jgi:hypothetical protein
MDIKEIFLQLTEFTTPAGYENTLEPYLPRNYKNDFIGNYYVEVGHSTPSVMFTSHLDNKCEDVQIVIKSFRNEVVRTDGCTILGADDKAGVSIMLDMIDNDIPGLYYFFIGEENGREGSTKLSKYLDINEDRVFSNINKVISFDRQGYEDVVIEQLDYKCCSDEFAKEISNRLNQFKLNYSPTIDGSFSDSYSFVNLYPECTNISVGYFNEHLESEYQDLKFLQKLSVACSEIDWESLPVKITVEK